MLNAGTFLHYANADLPQWSTQSQTQEVGGYTVGTRPAAQHGGTGWLAVPAECGAGVWQCACALEIPRPFKMARASVGACNQADVNFVPSNKSQHCQSGRFGQTPATHLSPNVLSLFFLCRTPLNSAALNSLMQFLPLKAFASGSRLCLVISWWKRWIRGLSSSWKRGDLFEKAQP